MKTQRSWIMAAALTVLAGPAVQAADTIVGSITADAQKVAFSHGFAWTEKPGTLSIGFFRTDPDAKEQARARAHGGNDFGVFLVPYVRMDLSFNEGSTTADLASFDNCHILFAKFDAGIFDQNAFKPGCGVVALSGDLKAGGIVHGKLKGRAEAFPRSDGTRPVYTWDVDFTATLH